MILHATVTEVSSGKSYVDGQQRITLRVAGGDIGYSKVTVPNSDGFSLDDELDITVTVRPLEPPPPWMQEVHATD